MTGIPAVCGFPCAGASKLLDGRLPVVFGCRVVPEVVVDLGAHFVSLGVMLRMQEDRAVHVCEGCVPVRRGQEGVSDRAVPVAHVMGQVKLDGPGSVGDGLLGVWWIGDGPGVCAAAPVGRVIGREFYCGGVVVDGVLVIVAVEMGGGACVVGAGRVWVQVDDFALGGDGGEPLGSPHMFESVSIEAFGVWVGDVAWSVLSDYNHLCQVPRWQMVWRW